MLAYVCRPGRGSENAVGWNRAVEAARRCDTWVLCYREWNEPVVRPWLDEHGNVPGLHFVFVPKGPALRGLSRLPGCYYLGLRLWNRRALGAARRLHAQVRFDLSHHVTYCGYREPGYLWRLGIPHVWGPVGGTQNLPRRFLRGLGILGALRESARSALNALQLRGRRVRRAARAARVVLAANRLVRDDFRRAVGVEAEVQLETGLTELSPNRASPPRAGEPFRLAWAGEFRAFKALPLLLGALARLPADVAWTLEVLGDGPRGAAWRRRATGLGIADRVTWTGWLPHSEARARLARAHAFVFTSLRDTSGNVVLEALAAGVPVVCLDHQGARDIVTFDCGIRLPVTDPGRVTEDLTRAIASLARGEIEWTGLSAAARERASEFLWERQGERMAQVYARMLGAP